MSIILDVETTGLPDRLGFDHYFPYTDINKYDNSRIVQFSFILCDDTFSKVETHDYVIKGDFPIPESDFHNITYELSQSKGISLSEVIERFENCLSKASHLIAHNIFFDINVLKSELCRIGKTDTIESIENKVHVCTLKNSTNILCLNKGKYGYKSPKLSELYKFATKKQIENAHNSLYDVLNLHEAMISLPQLIPKNVVYGGIICD